MSPQLGDRAFVDAVLAGDRDAFTWLYRAHVRSVAAAVRDNVHDPDSVAEVVQEVFVRALERLGSLRDRDRFGPWVLSIARHAAIDQRRYRLKCSMADDEGVDPPATGPGPDDLAELNELAELVRTCVSGLSPRDATALTLVLQFGLAPSDIAPSLGVSAGTAKVILHRARRRLRDALTLELLVRRHGGSCEALVALLDAGDLLTAGRHARSCEECETLAEAEVALYSSSPMATV